ncbi:DUF6549 family protein [Flavobacterium sp. RHBU_24]|uniref:DUF6549 family protein n=1 Tax=Flavobacterium sp. RHBU_24 TaxID=3391185 RepID=UPI0039850804
MKTKLLYTIIAGLSTALLFSVSQCRSIASRETTNTNALTDTVQYYTNVLGTQTAAIKTLKIDKRQLDEIILKKDKELAALAQGFATVHNVTQYETLTQYDTITVVYHDTVSGIFSHEGLVEKPWCRFRYTANQKGITLDSHKFPNTATVITGTKRKWFLGKETLYTEITTSNPYIKETEIKAAEVSLPTPVHKKWYVCLGIGLAGGFLLGREFLVGGCRLLE